jgi:XTP/dITP diphosphohydrolase
MRLIIATSNHNKLKEIQHILKGIKLSMVCLADLDKRFRITENGKTFFDNAVKKTAPVSLAYPNDLVAGEDSGLEIKCLNNEPGVRSKRYAGPGASDTKIVGKVLENLKDVPIKERGAQFHCCLVLMKAGKVVKKFDGTLKGRIHTEAVGKNGFGYDPILYLPKFKKTVAEISLEEKNAISHRAAAFNQLKKYLLK